MRTGVRNIVAVVVAACAAAGTASALTAASTLTPGTPAKPRGIRLTTTFGWRDLGEDVTSFQLWFPRGSLYNGAKYPTCSLATLDRAGPAGCPRGSIMGTGTGTALADQTVTRPRITVVNGGARVVYFFTVLNNPARVQQPVPGYITRLKGNFTYRLSATIPSNLRVVAGVPINLTSLTITAGRGSWLALTGAPAGIKVQTGYSNGASSAYMIWVQNT
jgi:hypothetical protein